MHRIFSNIKSPSNFPNIGKDSLSIDYLITQTDVPYEQEEVLGVEALYNLVHWPWGAQAVFANSAAKKYIFSRGAKAQGIAKRRYELVDKAIEINSKMAGLADSSTVAQLLAYQAGGIYGENLKHDETPIVAT